MPSLLRVVGVVVALVMIGVVIIATRRGTTRAIVTPLLLVGIGLLGISAAPDIVRPVQDFIGLGDQNVALHHFCVGAEHMDPAADDQGRV